MPPPKSGEPLNGTSRRPFALTFREATLVRLDGGQHTVKYAFEEMAHRDSYEN